VREFWSQQAAVVQSGRDFLCSNIVNNLMSRRREREIERDTININRERESELHKKSLAAKEADCRLE
jgi:hypothetical protein